LQPQVLVFFCSQPEHEIDGKTVLVAIDLLVQPLDSDTIKFGEVAIEDDPLVAEDQDSRFDWYGNGRRILRHRLQTIFFWLEVAICDLKHNRAGVICKPVLGPSWRLTRGTCGPVDKEGHHLGRADMRCICYCALAPEVGFLRWILGHCTKGVLGMKPRRGYLNG